MTSKTARIVIFALALFLLVLVILLYPGLFPVIEVMAGVVGAVAALIVSISPDKHQKARSAQSTWSSAPKPSVVCKESRYSGSPSAVNSSVGGRGCSDRSARSRIYLH
jgi:hypothetical protein